jgi:hypothetical protein
MAKVAIIYTGEARTIETTITYFKKNVILNENYHVFSVIQTNNIEEHNNLLINIIGKNLKKKIWFDKNDSTWITLRETQLEKMNLCDNWKNYLRFSGSMIEYYQMYLAYKLIETYENENNIKYDYVIRIRTDIIIKDVIDFDIIYEKNYIKKMLYKIKDFINSETIISEKVLYIFMNAFYNEKRIVYNMTQMNNFTTVNFNKLLETNNENQFVEMVYEYLTGGNNIITLRKNLVYFAKRNVLNSINILGITYGEHIVNKDNSYWFNAESQLENICMINNIHYFSSTTDLEDLSLYSYDHNNYFDENNELKEENFSFFIKRY